MTPSARQPGQAAGSASVRKGERATSLRYRMMALARTRENVISLGRGDPDLDTPAPIIEGGLAHFAEHGPTGSAPAPTPVRGLLSLREGIARRYAAERGVTVDPATEIAITNGAQEGLFLAMLALVDPGDRVACQDPRYSSYDQAIGVAGGEIVPIPTGGDRPFHLGADDLHTHAQDAKILVFVNPSNPTGSCVGPEGVRKLARAAEDLDLVVLSDEIYEDVVFGDDPFLSFLAAGGDRERTVVLSGFSKAYAMTGFRVGYLIGPPGFIDGVEALKSTTSGPCPAFSQWTALAALDAHPTRAKPTSKSTATAGTPSWTASPGWAFRTDRTEAGSSCGPTCPVGARTRRPSATVFWTRRACSCSPAIPSASAGGAGCGCRCWLPKR